MDSDNPPPLLSFSSPGTPRFCSCNCPCCGFASAACNRSVKRRFNEAFQSLPSSPSAVINGEVAAARVEAGDEVAALREALSSHQLTVQELCMELDEERSAASTAASEAMSMILRLQREKAEAQMEFRQFKRLAEERFAHDQQELAALDDLVIRRDHAIRSLSLQLRSYRSRLLSFGIDPDYVDLDTTGETPETPSYGMPKSTGDTIETTPATVTIYPPLRCTIPEEDYYEDGNAGLEENYCETPQIHEDLQNLNCCLYELEHPPSNGINTIEKNLNPQHHPVPPPSTHFHRSSADSYGQDIPNCGSDYYEEGDDADRVYTIDAVHRPPVVASVCDEPLGSPSGMNGNKGGSWGGRIEEEGDIKKLYARLQALEADRESMRQALISVRTEKAQLVLLREIAQHLCKEAATPQKKVVKKQTSFIRSFSIVAMVKWILSFIFWRRKATRSKYTFGHSNNNVGLLLLLERAPRMGQRRRL